jgi:hypothetical protein
MEPALLDTDTLSEIMKGIDPHVQDHARRYWLPGRIGEIFGASVPPLVIE